MSEFPNYSSQLMHQLWTMRNEGRFCDCTVVVEGVAYQAHKVVLAASSTLLRSYLISEDTIAINSDTVTSPEFSCLLDMIYTGKLPPGKHHISRIIAAADRLQMYDVAVSFKNLLTTILSQPQVPVTEAVSPTEIDKAQTPSPESSSSPSGDSSHLSSDKTETMISQRTESGGEEGEPASKRSRAEHHESSETEDSKSSESTVEKDCMTAAEMSAGPTAALLERLPQVVELLSSMSSILDLLSQTAQTSLDAQERQIVCHCCEEADPSSALEKLMSTVREGQLSKAALLKLLRAVQQKAPASFPTVLLGLLEELEDNKQEPGRGQIGETQNGTRDEEKMEGVQEKQETNKEGHKEEEKRAVDAATDTSSLSNAASPSNPSKPYDCRWCKKSFAYKCRMVAHVKRCPMSEEQEQQCPDCPAKLPSQHALQTHRTEAHRSTTRVKPKVACDLCGRTFAHPSGMIYHKRTEHFEEKPFVCEECGAKFGANSSLKNHMRLHTGEKPYHCKHCDMSFSVAAALAYHTKKKHSEGKMYGCQYCKAVFAQSIELTRHVRTHTGDRPYVCRECGKGYSQASGLTAHLHTFHNLAEPHDCQKCCLSFSSLEEHRQHIQEFHSKNCHKCLICSKLFTSAALLEKHRATHTGNRPFTCDLCSKSYLHLSGLWYHNRTSHPDVFASHTRQLQMLVQCDICFKFCPTAASLAKHHAAEHQGPTGTAMQCPICPTVVAGGEELEEHISDQHSSQVGEAFCCSLCSLLCSSQQELQRHVLSLHMGVLEEQDAKQEQPTTSHTVITAEPVGEAGTESIFSEQQVIVALAGTNDGESPGEVVEVNMYDLLNSSVTFVCEDQPQS